MEILEVESVIPDLIDGRAIKVGLPDLELQNDHERACQQHDICSATKAWDRQLKVDAAVGNQFWWECQRLQYLNLCTPGVALSKLNIALRRPQQRPQNGIDVLCKEVAQLCAVHPASERASAIESLGHRRSCFFACSCHASRLHQACGRPGFLNTSFSCQCKNSALGK